MKNVHTSHYKTIWTELSVSARQRLNNFMKRRIEKDKHRLSIYIEELKGLSPLYKLQAGYVYVSDEAGKQIRMASDVKKGQTLELTFHDGRVSAVVEKTENGEKLWQRKQQ